MRIKLSGWILLTSAVLSPFAQAKLWPRWTPSDFQKVTFSDGCAQNDWSATTDYSMTVLLSAFPGQTCTAELRFQSPIPLGDAYGLSFITKGASDRQTFTIQLLETLDHSTPVTSPAFEVDRHWTQDALRFNRLKPDWAPAQLAGFRIVTTSIRRAHGRTVFPLYMKDVRLISKGPTVAPADEPDASAALLGPTVERQGSGDDNRSTDAPHRARRHVPERTPAPGDIGAVLLMATLGTYWWWRRQRSTMSLQLSPLYEMNTRTWKSKVDVDGVIQIGGFDSISATDLQGLKKSGFHSVWFMGLWAIGARVRDISRRYGDDFKGSPFAISDYTPSEELGSEEGYKALIQRAHDAGLRVILDFVPNHMGLDSVWLNDHPEFFIHKVLNADESHLPDAELERRYPSYFPYRTPSYPQGGVRGPRTIMVAYGRDPYFYPWIDTAQLDYANPDLRSRMIDVLCDMARTVDGVRCDMAMLVLREQVKIHRHPEMSWDTFNRVMPHEFWPEAIRAAKRVNPNFVFLAETYWSLEGYLQQLGFDYTYNKPLYEAICSAFHIGHADGLINFLKLMGNDYLRKGVHFLENHDEERAMNALGDERQRGAAILLCTLPGLVLIHQGQMEGFRERLPVQRTVRIDGEEPSVSLGAYYKRLLQITNRPVFRDGQIQILYTNNPALICFLRSDDQEKVLVIINCSGHTQKGSAFLAPTIPLQTGAPYCLQDLFYELKPEYARQESSTQPSYMYAAAPLINQGLYVELQPYDAHLFLLERQAPKRPNRKVKPLASPRMTERRVNPRSPAPVVVETRKPPTPDVEPVSTR